MRSSTSQIYILRSALMVMFLLAGGIGTAAYAANEVSDAQHHMGHSGFVNNVSNMTSNQINMIEIDMIANNVNVSIAATITAAASAANVRAAVMPSFSSRSPNNGTKAALKAPSAKRRRKKLGNLKATKNASATMPVPRALAIRISRANPSRRLPIVQLPTVAIDRKRDMRKPYMV